MACRSLTIHTHYTIPHKWVVHFRLRHSHVHPPRQVSRTLKLSQLRAKLESGIEFYDGAFFLEFLEHINFNVSRSGAPLLRSPPRTLSALPHFACAVHPALSPRAGCESHDSCPPVCAGSKLIIYHVHPERAAASLAGAGAPRAPIRFVGPSPSHAAHHCLRAAGPRAIHCSAADDPGRLLCFLVLNFLIVPFFFLARLVC